MTKMLITVYTWLISLPARLKGMKIGKRSGLGWGYDWLFVSFGGITLCDDVLIGSQAWMQTLDHGSIIIGNRTTIGRRCVIAARSKIHIGNDCIISYGVSLLDHDHLVTDPSILPSAGKLTPGKSISIGDGCFIGAYATILKGVRLGPRCVVGAHAVVTKSFPAGSVLVGIPARCIRTCKA